MMTNKKTIRLRRNFNLLKLFARCANKFELRKAILENSDNDFVKALADCALNLVNGNVKVPVAQMKRIGRHRKIIREMAKKRNSIKMKKKLCEQKGGFLPALLVPVLAAVTGLVAEKLL